MPEIIFSFQSKNGNNLHKEGAYARVARTMPEVISMKTGLIFDLSGINGF